MENRSNNCKNQCQNKTTNQTNDQANHRAANQTTNSAANEHKHPNQYTKGADDEGAKNSTRSSARNRRCTVFQCGKQRAFALLISRWGQTTARAFQTARAPGPAGR